MSQHSRTRRFRRSRPGGRTPRRIEVDVPGPPHSDGCAPSVPMPPDTTVVPAEDASGLGPIRRIRPASVVLWAVTAATLTACSTTAPSGPAVEPHPASIPATTEYTDDMSTPAAGEGTPITLDIEGTSVTGTLFENTAARSLIDQLPLELSFTDYGGQEKIADLPAPLALEGTPAGSDAAPLTIGYYAPDQALVLYYEHVGFYNGIVRLGEFDDLEAVRDHDDAFTARLSRTD